MEQMNIYEVLKSFRAPLSEEQAWAVCFQCTKELLSQRETGFKTFQKQIIDIKLPTTKILKDGSIEFTSISPAHSPQKESEILFRLGSLVYECLDFGMEVCMERELDPSLEKLILDMTCDQGDEGISVSEHFEEKEGSPLLRERRLSSKELPAPAKDMTLELVLQRCTDHLGVSADPSDSPGHFKAVCRALVNEALELTAFLKQLYSGKELMSQSLGQGIGLTNWAYLQSLHAAEWAQLWLQAMKELRQGVTLRHVLHTKLPPSSFETTPFEMLLDDIRYHRFNLNHVSLTKARKSEHAHDVILEFIRSRPPLAKSSHRQLKPLVKISPNIHDKLLSEIKSCKKLKATPKPVLKSIREIYYGDDINLSPTESPPYVTPLKRRRLKPDLALVEKINRWDSPSPTNSPEKERYPGGNSVVSLKAIKSESQPSTPRVQLFEQFDSVDGREAESAEFKGKYYSNQSSQSSLDSAEDSCIRNGRFSSYDALGIEERPIFPPSLRGLEHLKITSKIYMTLNEVKHMRKTLARLELESFDPDELMYRSLISGRLCFTCRKRKFSIFGNWSRPCDICETRVCAYCLHKVEAASSYVFMEGEYSNRRDSGFCEGGYWPTCSSMPSSQSSPSLGAHCAPTKTHRVCVTCKRFISKHC